MYTQTPMNTIYTVKVCLPSLVSMRIPVTERHKGTMMLRHDLCSRAYLKFNHSFRVNKAAALVEGIQQFALFHYHRITLLLYAKKTDDTASYLFLNMSYVDIRTDCSRLCGSIECISSVKCPSHKQSCSMSSRWVA